MTLGTWAYLTQAEWRSVTEPTARDRIVGWLLALCRLLVAIAVLTIGFVLEPVIQTAMELGAEAAGNQLQPDLFIVAFFSALIPADIVTVVANEGKDRRERLQKACITAMVTLAILDTVWNFIAIRPFVQYLFSLFSDIVGGVVVGLVISVATEFTRTKRSGESSPSRG